MATISLASHLDYTVGWVAALHNERATAIGMLQERHLRPRGFSKVPLDPNAYSWGKIGDHNVVIASLPAGRDGKASAATTASFMLASFPNIRIGLMVGIGGGVPLPGSRDIRLGDVAVSQPSGTHGGVVQYDLGKLIVGDIFERKGSLNSPPEALLSGIAKVKAEHELQGNQINAYVDDMLRQYPRMSQARDANSFPYSRPAADTDRLFKDSIQHRGPRDCSKCDRSGMVERSERYSEPQIFYGVIASGDKTIKDAHSRARVVKDAGSDCICIEMEAAGLMNNFPCLVIRGICDYADTHKNDAWHNYAAATAAAYTRELLLLIEGSDVETTPKARDRLEDAESVPRPAFPGSNNVNLGTLREQVRKLADELEALKSASIPGSNKPHIECGHATIQRMPDGSGTTIKFQRPFSRTPVVTLTRRANLMDYYEGESVYLLQGQTRPAVTRTHFVAGCWGGGRDGRTAKILPFDWIAVEPAYAGDSMD